MKNKKQQPENEEEPEFRDADMFALHYRMQSWEILVYKYLQQGAINKNHQAKLVNIGQQLATHYASLVATHLYRDSAMYRNEDLAQSKSDRVWMNGSKTLSEERK